MEKTPLLNTRPYLALLCGCSLLGLSTQDSKAVVLNFGGGSQAGPWTLDAGSNNFIINDNSATPTDPAAFDGVISGPGDLIIRTNDASNAVRIAQLNKANTYAGDTTIQSVDSRFGVRLGINNGLPTTTVLTLRGSDESSDRPAWFDLNGFSQELSGIANLSNDGSIKSAIVNGNAATAGTLIVTTATDRTYTAFLGADNAHGNITQGTVGATATGIPEGEGNNFSLTKAGSGKLTLTRANSYTGDTIINNGTLSIQSAYLADAADLYMTAAALFDLDFTGTDMIDSLFIDNVPQATGTWGALGSGADNQSALFTGTGLIQVATQVPEPSACLLFGLGGLGLLVRRRK